MSDLRDDYLKFKVDDYVMSEKKSIFSTLVKVLSIVLLVLLVAVLGGLGYKYLLKKENKTEKIDAVQTTEVLQVDETTAPVQTQENTKEQQVAQAVATQMSQGNLKKEEIALIVKSVLEQMKNKTAQPQTQQDTTTQEQPVQPVQTTQATQSTIEEEQPLQPVQENTNDDQALLNDLSTADVDTVKDEEMDLSGLDGATNKQVEQKKDTKKADTFNKVIIKKEEVSSQDDLTKLYSKLNKIIKKDNTKVKKSNYVSNLKKETKVRKNAMRIITVRRGDTLSLIAARAYGDAMMYPKIFEANPDLIKNPNRIYPGQKLRVPK